MAVRRNRSRIDAAAPDDQILDSTPDRVVPAERLERAPRREAVLSDAQEASIETVLMTSTWEVDHVRQVRHIAGWMFESLREYHGLGVIELALLEAAALLHDVGYPIDPANHHKVSGRIIRALLGAPFSQDQIQLIALLARYHRKATPQLKQRRYAQLDDRGRRLVCWLGGILRVADGLDRPHDSAVGWLNTAIVEGRLEIRASVRPYPVRGALAKNAIDLERLVPHIEGATRKRKLLERAIGMPVVIRAV
jgi:exopolyphosphatase/guanosine-5'-triphosphate,3'-diphosphate pyrophosphatase